MKFVFSVAGRELDISLQGNASAINEFAQRLQVVPRKTAEKHVCHASLEIHVVDDFQGFGDEYVVTRDLFDSSRLQTFRIEHLGFFGHLSKKGHYEGVFRIDRRSPPSLLLLLRSCMEIICEAAGELLVHASGVFRNQRLWLFSGPSGVGKSTVAQELCDGGEAFSYDMVVLFINNNQVMAWPTLFSAPPDSSLRDHPLPVDGIVFLEQATETDLRPLTPREALTRLLAESLISLRQDPEVMNRALNLVGAVCDRNMCYHLRFQRNPSFWALIDQL